MLICCIVRILFAFVAVNLTICIRKTGKRTKLLSPSILQSINQSINVSINLSISQLMNPLIDQSINQTTYSGQINTNQYDLRNKVRPVKFDISSAIASRSVIIGRGKDGQNLHEDHQQVIRLSFSLIHYGPLFKKTQKNSHLIIHFPTSEGVGEVSKQANKQAQRSANEGAVRANEGTNEQVASRPICILSCSGPSIA